MSDVDWEPSSPIGLFTEACLAGFVAGLGSMWFSGTFNGATLPDSSINYKELFCICAAVASWRTELANMRVLSTGITDSSSTRSRLTFSIMCVEANCEIGASHIAGMPCRARASHTAEGKGQSAIHSALAGTRHYVYLHLPANQVFNDTLLALLKRALRLHCLPNQTPADYDRRSACHPSLHRHQVSDPSRYLGLRNGWLIPHWRVTQLRSRQPLHHAR